MSKRRWMTQEELMGPTPKTFVSEAIDYEVDFVVEPETAEARARRRWHMNEEEVVKC